MNACPIKVSTMTGKLAGFFAINFNPQTCHFCNKMRSIEGTVCTHCYSHKMMRTSRVNCNAAWSHNAHIMSRVLHDQELPRFPLDAVVRFLAHGDMDNVTQLINFIQIARVNPLTHFALWTKRTDLVAEAFAVYKKPDNLTLIQSSVFIGRAEVCQEHFNAVFTVYPKGQALPADTHHCADKKCADCMYCYADGDLPYDISEALR